MFTLKNSTRGFTLIELLVVITIIGILATGATSVYTSQIQKARDTTRITDVEALKSGIEQAYQDTSSYPAVGATFSVVATYTPKFPKDPKSGQTASGTSLDYAYMAGPDSNGILLQEYEISNGFENGGTMTSKGGGDGGNDPLRLEMGINTSSNATNIAGVQTVATWVATPATPAASACVAAGSATPVVCSGNIMILR